MSEDSSSEMSDDSSSEMSEDSSTEISKDSTTEISKDSTTKIFDPDSFLAHTRFDFGKRLMPDAPPNNAPLSDDLPYLLRATNALIATNKEIWERCADKRDTNCDGSFCFSRVTVHKVECKTCKIKIKKRTGTRVSVHPQIFCKDFEMLPPIPSNLLNLIPAHDLPASQTGNSTSFRGFPDYELYLAKAGCLNETILVPFLLQLKEHLESLQVFLGGIDSFLSESMLHAPFLEELFGTKITVPIQFKPLCLERETRPPTHTICDACKQGFYATRYRTQNGFLTEVCSRCNDPFIPTPSLVKIFDTPPQKLTARVSSLRTLDAIIFLGSEENQRKLKLLKECIVST